MPLMASIPCMRCLHRPSISLPIRNAPTISSISPFSTSAAVAAKGPATLSQHIRKGKTLQYKKRKISKPTGKPALPGERKAFRKRIQLSNSNALPVAGLEPMSTENMADEQSEGKLFRLPEAEVIDQLRAVEAFKSTQSWGLFRHPSAMIRTETVELVRKMHAAVEKKEAMRMVITGNRLSGKSTLLLQALVNGFLNEWIVINVPEAQELTNAQTDYHPINGTSPTQYAQPSYTMKLLQSMRKSSEQVLANLSTSKTHTGLPVNVPVGTPLLNLLLTARENDHAWPVFRALWAELTDPSAERPPVLLAVDGLAHIMKMSDYRSPSYELVHAHDLALVRLIVDALSGETKLPHGGAVLGVTSLNNAPRSPSTDLAIAQRLAEQKKIDPPTSDPYFRFYDARVEEVLRTVEVMHLSGIDKSAARSLMQYWAASGVLRTPIDEKNVVAAWSLGGNGIVGEMERASLMHMRL